MADPTILNRNRSLKYADSLLVLQPPIPSKSGIWYMAFAKMGEEFVINDEIQSDFDDGATGGFYTGATAIFKILQQRPAIMEKQLRRPTAAVAAGLGHSGTLDSDRVQKDAKNGGQKRRRL